MGTLISVDVESDGPCPGIHSMVCFGAVVIEEGFKRTFYGEVSPISDVFVPEALAISGFTRDQHSTFPNPTTTMLAFDNWLRENCDSRPIFWSDNNSYDFAFINYYFHRYLGRNPFGWSSQNINSLYKGLSNDMWGSFKRLRDTKHTHHPVDDAMGNAEALLKMINHINGSHPIAGLGVRK